MRLWPAIAQCDAEERKKMFLKLDATYAFKKDNILGYIWKRLKKMIVIKICFMSQNNAATSVIYTIILRKSFAVRKLQVAILARSSREMS